MLDIPSLWFFNILFVLAEAQYGIVIKIITRAYAQPGQKEMKVNFEPVINTKLKTGNVIAVRLQTAFID